MPYGCYACGVGVRLASPAGRRRASWILVLAILPTLTFFGHWPEQVSIPGTGYSFAIPGSFSTVADGATSGGHDHSSHCHADAASCSDVPATAGVSFALLNENLTLFGAGGLFVLLAVLWWVPGERFAPAPEIQPPRAVAASC
jgi:hypothetical protein